MWPYGLDNAVLNLEGNSAAGYILDESNDLFFSPASIWEVVTKQGLGRDDFKADPNLLYRGLINNGYKELCITSNSALLIGTMPPIHKDPFDRMLLAQAIAEGIPLLTADGVMEKYPAPVILIK